MAIAMIDSVSTASKIVSRAGATVAKTTALNSRRMKGSRPGTEKRKAADILRRRYAPWPIQPDQSGFSSLAATSRDPDHAPGAEHALRSEEPRVGRECRGTREVRWVAEQ